MLINELRLPMLRIFKNVIWSFESPVLLGRSLDGWVRILHKQDKTMDASCLVTIVQAGGRVIVWGVFS